MIQNLIFNLTKNLFFLFHLVFIFTTIFFPIINSLGIILQFIVILSWIFNDNNCLITQLEYMLFKQTLTQYIGIAKNNNLKFKVPFLHRLLVYIIFLYNIFCIFPIVLKTFLINYRH